LAHGCKAGRYRDALRDVYLGRLMRGDEYYAAYQLGALGPLLSALARFFEPGEQFGRCDWGRPITAGAAEGQELTKEDHLRLLRQAVVCFQAAKSYAAPEVKRACTRWLELCQEMKNIRDEERFAALRGKWVFCLVEGDLKTAEHVARECWNIA